MYAGGRIYFSRQKWETNDLLQLSQGFGIQQNHTKVPFQFFEAFRTVES